MKTFQSAIAFGLCLLLAWPAQALSGVDFSRRTKVYLYRTGVFADQYVSVGLPANESVLRSKLWYIRPEESLRALFGMPNLASFIQAHAVPGLDLSNDRMLISSDMERLLSSLTAPHLRILKLSGTRVGDEALPGIGKLYDLQVLEFGSQITDRGIVWLRNLENLKILSLSGPGVSDKSMPVIAGLQNLERLSIKSTEITDASVPALAKLSLRQFDAGPKITDQGLSALSSVQTLEQMDLSQAHVTQAGLAKLVGVLGIHTLFLGASVSDVDLSPLLKFKNLKRLDLTGARLTDKGIAVLSLMDGLEELALTNTQITGASLGKLNGLSHLRYLEISGTRIGPEDFKTVSGFNALQVISLSSEKRMRIDDIKAFGRMPRLHSILINGVMLGPEVVNYLRRRQTLRWPSWVAVAEAADVADGDVEHALQIASAVTHDSSHAFQGFEGLKRIHEAEASLEDVTAASDRPRIETFEENEKNFLGEITVGATTSKTKTAPPKRGIKTND